MRRMQRVGVCTDMKNPRPIDFRPGVDGSIRSGSMTAADEVSIVVGLPWEGNRNPQVRPNGGWPVAVDQQAQRTRNDTATGLPLTKPPTAGIGAPAVPASDARLRPAYPGKVPNPDFFREGGPFPCSTLTNQHRG